MSGEYTLAFIGIGVLLVSGNILLRAIWAELRSINSKLSDR